MHFYMSCLLHPVALSKTYISQACLSSAATIPPITAVATSRNLPRNCQHGSLNVPIEHHPTIRYMVYNGYYKVMSNIPKMRQLPTPLVWVPNGPSPPPLLLVAYTAGRHGSVLLQPFPAFPSRILHIRYMRYRVSTALHGVHGQHGPGKPKTAAGEHLHIGGSSNGGPQNQPGVFVVVNGKTNGFGVYSWTNPFGDHMFPWIVIPDSAN